MNKFVVLGVEKTKPNKANSPAFGWKSEMTTFNKNQFETTKPIFKGAELA